MDAEPTETTPRGGRRAQAARNDQRILDAAREVLVADPRAPVSAVAERAGVGMSALYRRFADKEDMVRRVCHDGLLHFIAAAESALADHEGWDAFVAFLTEVVDADLHSLTVRLAGTFETTEQMWRDAARAEELTATLVAAAHADGRLREDVGAEDVPMLLELMAAIRTPDDERTRCIRGRYLTLLLDGLTTPRPSRLPGTAPTQADLGRTWDHT